MEWVSWRWIFLLNLPLAAAAVVLALLGREEESPSGAHGPARPRRRGARSDRLRAPDVRARRGGRPRLRRASGGHSSSPRRPSAAFVVVETRVAEPMLPFALFRERNFAAANAQTFLVYAGLYGFFVFFTLYLQFLGFTPFEAGLLNIPSSVVMILLAARFGGLADRHGPRLYLTVGPALIGLGTLVFAIVDTQLGVLDLRHRRAPALLARPGDDGGADHGDGAQVGARALRGHRLGRQLHGLAPRKPHRHRGDRPRHRARLRGAHRRRERRAAGEGPDARRSCGRPRWKRSARAWRSPPRSRSRAPPSAPSASRTGRPAARRRPQSANRRRRQPKRERRERARGSARAPPPASRRPRRGSRAGSSGRRSRPAPRGRGPAGRAPRGPARGRGRPPRTRPRRREGSSSPPPPPARRRCQAGSSPSASWKRAS